MYTNRLAGVYVTAFLFDGVGCDSVAQAIADAGDDSRLKKVEVELDLVEFVRFFQGFRCHVEGPAPRVERAGIHGSLTFNDSRYVAVA